MSGFIVLFSLAFLSCFPLRFIIALNSILQVYSELITLSNGLHKILPNKDEIGQHFGHSVSMSDDGLRAIIGAPEKDDSTSESDNAGSVYIISRSNSSSPDWKIDQEIYSPVAQANADFGSAVAISGDGSTIAVGALRVNNFPDNSGIDSGAAFIFKATAPSNDFSHEASLYASDGLPGANFGHSIALDQSGLTCIVGAYGHDEVGVDSVGSAYIYSVASPSSSWSQDAKLTVNNAAVQTPNQQDRFGSSVDLDDQGLVALVGASGRNEAFLFQRAEGSKEWNFQSSLDAGSRLGDSVCLNSDGTVAVVGSTLTQVNGVSTAGSGFVFERGSSDESATWEQTATLESDRPQATAWLGTSCSISADGSKILLGADEHDVDTVSDAGAAIFFSRSKKGGYTWNQTFMTAGNGVDLGNYDGEFGRSVALDRSGNFALIGAYKHSSTGAVFPSCTSNVSRDISCPSVIPATSESPDLTGSEFLQSSTFVASDLSETESFRSSDSFSLSNSPNQLSTSSLIPIIIGSSVGALVCLLLVIFLLFFLARRRKKKSDQEPSNGSSGGTIPIPTMTFSTSGGATRGSSASSSPRKNRSSRAVSRHPSGSLQRRHSRSGSVHQPRSRSSSVSRNKLRRQSSLAAIARGSTMTFDEAQKSNYYVLPSNQGGVYGNYGLAETRGGGGTLASTVFTGAPTLNYDNLPPDASNQGQNNNYERFGGTYDHVPENSNVAADSGYQQIPFAASSSNSELPVLHPRKKDVPYSELGIAKSETQEMREGQLKFVHRVAAVSKIPKNLPNDQKKIHLHKNIKEQEMFDELRHMVGVNDEQIEESWKQ